MNITKRWLSVLLCMIVTVSAFVITTSAASGATNVSLSVEKTEVNVGDTFTVTLSNTAMTVKGFTCGFYFDNTLLECVSIIGPWGDSSYFLTKANAVGFPYVTSTSSSTVEKANANGTVGFAVAGTTDTAYVSGTLFTVTFKAKAAGTAEFTSYEETNGTDAFKSDSIETKTVTITEAAPEHTCSLTPVAGQSATCVDSGWNGYYKCSDDECGKLYSDAEGTDLIEDLDSWKTSAGKIPAIDHENKVHHEEIPANCKETGTIEYWSCPDCGKNFSDEACATEVTNLTIDVDGNKHENTTEDNGTPESCTSVGYTAGVYCNDCETWISGHAEIEKADHFDGEDENHDCDNCSETNVDDGHTGGTATCKTLAVCSECGESYGEVNSNYHTGEIVYVDNHDATHHSEYSCCNAVIENSGAAHSYEYDCSTTCKDCNSVTRPNATHAFNWDCDTVCNLCNQEVREASHSIDHKVKVDATCKADGNIEYWYCTICGDYYSDANGNNLIDNKESVILKSDENAHNYKISGYTNITEESHTVNYVCENDATHTDAKVEQHSYDNGVCVCTAEEHKCSLSPVSEEKATCSSTGIKAHYKCSVCGNIYEDADGKTLIPSAVTDINPNNHAAKATYTNNGDGTHSSVYKCCNTPGVTDEKHSYGDSHVCACGVVEPYGWVEIEGAWYYVDSTTYEKATGLTRVPYPAVAINGINYAPNSTDKVYWEAHKNDEEDPSLYTDAETAVFVFGADGKLNQSTGVVVDGNLTRYAVNGMIPWHIGMVEIDGEYYYFAGDEVNGGGNIMKTGKVYATRDYNSGITVGDKVIYTFGEDGKLCLYDGVVKLSDGYYYYNNYRLEIGAGLVQLDDGSYIYVRSTGKLATGEYWLTKNNDLPVKTNKMYTFDENGYLVNPIDPSKNGIYLEDGGYYYYVAGDREYAGAIVYTGTASDGTIYDNDIIYVTSSGKLATGTYWPTKHNENLESNWYEFDDCGRCIVEQ